ncbi:MAG TPA: chemotaxis protein CheW [Terracidiphilus sp.]|jgi:purine-binding chemotaxis protein CheW|nr:chemotaxis protein CheW [Terracidiphilus sp.]
MNLRSKATTEKAKTASFADVCSVRVGPSLFGLPIRHILEIVGSVLPQAVPLAPPFVGGLVHYRGDVLTTVSMRFLLSLPPLHAPQAILVLESPGGAFGLLVDSVVEVLTLAESDLEPNPATLGDACKHLFTGAYKLKSNLLVMLDPEGLDPLRLSTAQAA